MTENWRNVSAIVGLLLLVWVVYLPVGGFGYIALDDPAYTYHNDHVRDGLSPEAVQGAFFAFHNGGWHPLTTLSQQLDVSLFGLRPGPMHLVNVFLHGIVVVLLYFVFQLALGAWLPAFLAAAFFAVHPQHVEPVAWIASRKDVLSGAFIALALLFYTQYGKSPNRWRYLLVTAACSAAYLSKGTAVVLPALFLLWDRWPLQRWRDRHDLAPLSLEKLPWLALALPIVWINGMAQASAGALRSLDETAFSLRLSNALVAIPQYLGQTFWPTGLSPYYPLPAEGHGAVAVLLGAVFVAAVTLCVLIQWRRWPVPAMAWCWFLVALAPVIGLAAIGDHARADRFVYVPHMGLFAGLAFLLYRGAGARLAAVLGAVAVVALTALSMVQVRHWADTGSLFAHAVAVDPDNPLAHMLLGQALDDAGAHEDAVAHLEEALALRPTLRDAWNSLGLARAHLGLHEAAIDAYERELRLAPDHVMAMTNQANSLMALERGAEALALYRQVTTRFPDYADGHGNLGSALLMLGETETAIPALETARALAPGEVHWHINLAAAYWQGDRIQAAQASLATALALAPEHPTALALQAQFETHSPKDIP